MTDPPVTLAAIAYSIGPIAALLALGAFASWLPTVRRRIRNRKTGT